jgi:uroporphyrin-III C-methyltransferase
MNQSDTPALVSLVGAGPGDPELLTLRAVRRLSQADAVIHDRLVSSAVLDYCRLGCRRIDAGKSSARHTMPQEDINQLLIDLALSGQRIVRLKGGDPFVFGRGGEEAQALVQAGIPFEVVPGVSSAFAAAAVAGIPVTHRGIATAVTVVTGHTRAGGGDVDWQAYARVPGTLVVLMAVENLAEVVHKLLTYGRPADQAAAMIESATTPFQRVVYAALGQIIDVAAQQQVRAPAVLVVGDTVALGQQLGWCFPLTSPAVQPSDGAQQADAEMSSVFSLMATR